MADGTIRGQFVWHDLVTPNTAGAHEFYAKAVGWTTETWGKDHAYQMFAAPSGPIGGTVENRATTPHWLAYIGTADVDATVETATRLGARVVTAAQSLPNGGRYAMLADPQGAAFGIYAATTHAAGGEPKPGEFSWHELATSVEPSAAFAFYSELFAWDEITRYDMGPMGQYLIFGRDGRQLGGMFDKGAAGKPGNAYWLAYVSVADLEAAVEQSKAARGSVLTGPMDVPGGDRIAQLMDPYGAFFALHMAAGAQRAPATQAAQPVAKPAARTAVKRASPKKPAKKARTKKAAPKKNAAARKPAKKKPAAKPKAPARVTGKPKAKARAKAKAKAKKKGRR